MRVDSAPSAPKPDFDAGLTGQIRLDMGEEE
jgi:hypothetical protein